MISRDLHVMFVLTLFLLIMFVLYIIRKILDISFESNLMNIPCSTTGRC
jgi:uncharacterized membrane protein (DUF485 family)